MLIILNISFQSKLIVYYGIIGGMEGQRVNLILHNFNMMQSKFLTF